MLIKNDFAYFAPRTLEKALQLLGKYPEESKVFAGGQSLLVLMKQGLISPRFLIDIKRLDKLNYIKLDKKQGLLIGALTSHRTVETSSLIKSNFPVLAEMESCLASLETRNWGTIGGNICHADPAGDVCPVLVALEATVKMDGPKGERTMLVEDFSLNYFETALAHDELLTEIRIPESKPYTGVAYEKFNLTRNDYATAATAVSITLNSSRQKCTRAKIVLGAIAPTPLRVKAAEDILVGQEITPVLLERAAGIAMENSDPVADMHASAEYKKELVKALVMKGRAESPGKSPKRLKNKGRLMQKISLTINGKPYQFKIETRMLLIELLRNELNLTGTRMGCSCSSCAACTVILDGKAVKSCSVLAVQANGRKVVTIEGLANGDSLHPVQESFIKNHGMACGYCTPGMIMEVTALLDENANPTEQEVREAISGHLCRCGTYPKIIRSALEAAKVMRGE